MRVAFLDWGGGQIPQREVKEEGTVRLDHRRCLPYSLNDFVDVFLKQEVFCRTFFPSSVGGMRVLTF